MPVDPALRLLDIDIPSQPEALVKLSLLLPEEDVDFKALAALIEAHERLAHSRPDGDTLVAVYAEGDPGGFGPALQIVTDQATMLMDSVTVLLHRLGVAYVALMNPVASKVSA